MIGCSRLSQEYWELMILRTLNINMPYWKWINVSSEVKRFPVTLGNLNIFKKSLAGKFGRPGNAWRYIRQSTSTSQLYCETYITKYLWIRSYPLLDVENTTPTFRIASHNGMNITRIIIWWYKTLIHFIFISLHLIKSKWWFGTQT